MRRHNLAILAFALVGVMLLSSLAISSEKKAVEPKKINQSLCPVMDKKIDKSVYLDFQVQRIYFCCPRCLGKFKDDPEPFMKKIDKGNVLLESVQVLCPLCGEALNKKTYVDYKGRRIFFCGLECKEEFTKSPEVFLQILATQQGERSYGCGVNKPPASSCSTSKPE